MCIIENCENPDIKAKGLCRSHYHRLTRHGDPLGGGRTRVKGRRQNRHSLHPCWRKMIERCYSATCRDYPNYGGRGIQVCKRWREDFWAFVADMGPKPTSKHTIERDDNDGNYESSNCRWATKKEQACNKRSNHLLIVNGIPQLISALAEKYNIDRLTIRRRLKRGWSEQDAATRPGYRQGGRQKAPAAIGFCAFPIPKDRPCR